MLGQCPSLAHLDLGGNDIEAEGVGRLAAVLGHCPSLARLDCCHNSIGDEVSGRLAALPQCLSLACLMLQREIRTVYCQANGTLKVS